MKKTIALLLTLAMVFALCACGSTQTAAPAAPAEAAPADAAPAAEEAYATITITADRATDEAQMIMVNYIVENIPAKTNGRVNVELITPGTMGSLGEMTDGIMMGTLDMAAVPELISGPFLSTNLGFLQLTGLVGSYEEAAEVFGKDGWLGQYLNEAMEKDGMKRMGLCDNGFRTVGSVDKPLVELSDYAGVKVRVAEVKENIFEYTELGALPVAISSSELLNALENGTVDACDQSITNYVSNGIEGSVKYINLIYDRYSSSSLLMNLDKWNSLTAEDQEIVAAVCSEACDMQFQASKDIAMGYIEKFTADGTWEVSERSESVDNALKEVTVKLLENYSSDWDPEVVELVKANVG